MNYQKYAVDSVSQELIILDEKNEIVKNLWLGMIPEKPDFNLHYIINVAPNKNQTLWLHPHQTRFADKIFEDKPYLPDIALLHELADLTNECREKGPTLVHCHMGINRSALILGLALVKSGMDPLDAIVLMRQKRSNIILSNKVFHDWLIMQRKDCHV